MQQIFKPKLKYLLFQSLTIILACISSGIGQINWEVQHCSAKPGKLVSVSFCNNMFVATGEGGTILTSIDGLAWTASVKRETDWYRLLYSDLNTATFGNNQFLAFGNSTTVSSNNGYEWNHQLFLSTAIRSAVYGTRFVAVGDKGNIIYSSQIPIMGLMWSSLNLSRSINLHSVIFNNDKYVAVGDSGMVYTSQNGATWAAVSAVDDTINLNSIAFDNGVYMAVGGNGTIISSPNCTTWTAQQSNSSRTLNSICYGNNKFIAVGSAGTLLSSNDGIIWNSISSPVISDLYSIAYGNNKFVAVGSDLNNEQLWVSTDGLNWQKPNSINVGWLTSVTYGNGQFIGVGLNGLIISSPDCSTWTNRYSPTFNHIKSICFNNNKFVAVGKGVMLYTDSYATTWKSAPDFNYNVNSVSYGNNLYVAVGPSGTIITSIGDTNWTKRISNTVTSLKSVAFGNNLFVAVGLDSCVYTSSNGIDWAWQSIGLGGYYFLESIVFGNNRFVAVGKYGIALTSTDGVTWEYCSTGSYRHLYSVAIRNSQFIAVGDSGTVLFSPDGKDWTLQNSKTTHVLNSIAYNNDHFVAVGGQGGTILSSVIDKSNAKNILNSNYHELKMHTTKTHIILIFPQPILNKQITVEIFNVSGARIYSTITNVCGQSIDISISGISSGKYLLYLTESKNTGSPLVIKSLVLMK